MTTEFYVWDISSGEYGRFYEEEYSIFVFGDKTAIKYSCQECEWYVEILDDRNSSIEL